MQEPDWETGSGGDQPSLDLRELLAVAWKWRLWIVACCFLGGLIGLGMAAAKPNTYTSTAKLLLHIGRREKITSETLFSQSAGESSEPTLLDELHLLDDGNVYRQVAQEVGPATILRPDDPRRYDGPETSLFVRWLHSFQAWLSNSGDPGQMSSPELEHVATKILQENTVVRSETMTNVISVAYTSTSPQRAQSTAERIVAAFIERHRQHFSVSGYLESNVDKLERARDEYETARAQFDVHRTECGFLLVDTELAALVVDIHGIEQDQEVSLIRFAEIEVQLEHLRERIKGVEETVETRVPAQTRPNEEYRLKLGQIELWDDRRQLLDEMALSLDEKQRRSEEYERISRAIEEELSKMQRDIVVRPADVAVTPNPDYVDLEGRIAELELEAASLARRMEEQAGLLAGKNEHLKSLHVCLNDHHRIQAEIDRKETVYLGLAQRFADLEALASIDVGGDTNLRVIHAPNLPWTKDGPNRKKTVFIGLLGGAAVSLGLVIARHLLRNRLGDPRSVDRLLGVPVLAVVHESKSLQASSRTGAGRSGDREAPR